MNTLISGSLLTAAFFSVSAQAALYDRGNGLIYDDVIDVTWLQDANYAQTSGYDADGLMTREESYTWADQLTYAGYADWRLPSVGNSPISGPVPTGELGYMFYGNLGNSIGSSILRNVGFTDAASGLNHSFDNVNSSVYWYGEVFGAYPLHAWIFNTRHGIQGHRNGSASYYSWAVRAGDVSSVPVPAAAWLFGSALLGLAGIKRKK